MEDDLYFTWNGTDTIGKPIQKFFEKLEQWFESKNTLTARRWVILDTRIERPAKHDYDAAILAGGIVNTPYPDQAADVGGILRTDNERYVNRKNWLINRYHGEMEQEAIKDAITNMRQGETESPKNFYSRVAIMVEDAGYPDAVRPHQTQSTWLAGLQPAIKMHVLSMPTADIEVKKQNAENWWNARKKVPNYELGQYQNDPPPQQPQILKRNPQTRTVEPQQQMRKPDLVNDDLAKMFEQMEIRLVNRFKGMINPRPQRSFGNPRPQQTERERDPMSTVKCYKCLHFGHFARDCKSEKNINTVEIFDDEEWYPEDEEELYEELPTRD